MLNESMPTASARTASSTVLRITTSPLSSRPDWSTLMGTNESKPNSMSGVVVSVSSLLPLCLPPAREPGCVKDLRALIGSVRSGSRRCRKTEELAEPVDHQVPPLDLGDGLAPDDPVLSGELTRPAGGPDGHRDGDAHRLVVGEIGSSLGEG